MEIVTCLNDSVSQSSSIFSLMPTLCCAANFRCQKETRVQRQIWELLVLQKTKNKCELKLSVSVSENTIFPRNLILIHSIRYITLSIKINSTHKLQIKYTFLLLVIYQMLAKFLLWRFECIFPLFS